MNLILQMKNKNKFVGNQTVNNKYNIETFFQSHIQTFFGYISSANIYTYYVMYGIHKHVSFGYQKPKNKIIYS